MEKPCVSQVREALNPSVNFALITEMQHIAIKASRTVEMELTQTVKQSYITSYFVSVNFLNICMFE